MGSRTAIRLFAGLLLLCGPAVSFADYVVNTDVDEDVDGDGTCSLREAIKAVNGQANYHDCTSATSGESNVSFAIAPNAGEVHVIALASALPDVTHAISIDATTQSGASCAPVPNLRVQIANPSSLAIDGLALEAGSGFSVVTGLAFGGFSSSPANAGVRVDASDIQLGCLIAGADAAGLNAQPNTYGVYINGDATQLGFARNGAWLSNLLSGNTTANVFVDLGGCYSTIAGNYIGVDASGASALPSAYGVYVFDAQDVSVGYTDAAAPAAAQRNVIAIASPPSTTAINVQLDHASETTVAGNYIGVAADGQTALPIGSTGIDVSVFQSMTSLIGCNGTGADDACRNVIANPAGVAIDNFEGSVDTAVVGNFIGMGADGATPFGGSPNAIAVVMSGADTLVARNVITTGGLGTGVLLNPNTANQTPVFLNQTAAGAGGATLDSSENCLQGNGNAGVTANTANNPTVISTTFTSNWWGATDGPAPNGSGNSAASNVVYDPFLTAPSTACGFDVIFASNFD